MSSTNQVKIGVVGVGTISELHLNAYKNNPNVRIEAICDLNEERAKATAAKYGAPQAFSDYHRMFAEAGLDGVSICTWNNTHEPIAIAALQAGLHVLLEKPLSTTVEAALRIEEAVRSTGRKLQVGYVRRYDNNAQLVKQFADAGEFGEFYYAKASSIRRVGNPGGWFTDKERSGGGPVIDIGVHVVDLCWYLMGRPKPVSVSANTYRKLGNRANVKHMTSYKAADYDASRNTVEDMANAIIRFEGGASLLLEASFTLHAKENKTTISLFGDKGGVEIDPALAIVTEKHDTILNVTPQTDHPGFHLESAFQNEINHFVDCVRTGAEPISPVSDGVAVMKMLCGIYESAEKGEEIRLS
ncbi:Gfo/Idh/MocA family protein [Cohnella sp. GCM10012308]|uniref:Gfo/Idh/MocA family protein n=1 Tax=Cohnella sp. GCM10012308 TaxID=3317329 RepID=UPI0036151697